MRIMEGRRTSSLIRALRLRASLDVVEQDPWAGEDERWAAEDREQDEFERLAAELLEEDDPLAPARAVIVGVLLVVPLWLLIGGAAYAIYRALS